MARKYNLNDTYEVLCRTLNKDFGVNDKEAEFCVTLLAMSEEDNITEELNEDDLLLWYLDHDAVEEHFTTPMGLSRLNISFTKLTLDLLKDLFGMLGGSLFEPQGPDDMKKKAVMQALKDLVKSFSYVRDEELCVYLLAIERWKEHGFWASFSIEDFLKDLGLDKKTQVEEVKKIENRYCLWLDKIRDKKFSCIYCHDEYCTVREDYIRLVVDRLVDQGIFTKTKEDKCYKFKI